MYLSNQLVAKPSELDPLTNTTKTVIRVPFKVSNLWLAYFFWLQFMPIHHEPPPASTLSQLILNYKNLIQLIELLEKVAK